MVAARQRPVKKEMATKPLRGEIQRSARPLVIGECLSMRRPGTPSGSDSLVRLQDPRLHVSFRLRVPPLQEVRLQARGHLDDAEPSSRRGPLLFQDRAVSLDVPVGFRAVFRAQLDRDPDLLEADRDEGPQRVEDLLHLLLDRLERVDVDLGLLHRVLDALGWMGSAGLRVDRVRRDVLDDLLALRLQHLPTLFRGQLDLARWMICFATARGSVVPKNSAILSSDAFEPLWASLKISSIASSFRRSTSLPSRTFWTASGFTRISNFSPDFSTRAITYSLNISSRRSLP